MGLGGSLLGEASPVERALDFLRANWPLGEPGLEANAQLVSRGLRRALTVDLLGGGRLEGVEADLDVRPDAKHPVRADLIHTAADGVLTVTDFKAKLSLDIRYLAKELRDTETMWQLKHYAWRASLKYNRWVGRVRKFLVVCSPTARAELDTVEVAPEALIQWLRSASTVWQRMYIDSKAPDRAPLNTESCYDFGGCWLYDGCHKLHGDQSKFPALYDPKVWS